MNLYSFLLLGLCAQVSAYHVALFTPHISKSQVVFNKRIAETLANAGHNVTMIMITQFFETDTSAVKIPDNVSTYYVDGANTWTQSEVDTMQSKKIFSDVPFWDAENRKFMAMWTESMEKTCRKVLQNKEFMRWLEAEKFDIGISHMYNTCPIGLIHAAKMPTWIWMNSGMLMDFVSTTVGVPTVPSYVPPVVMEAHDRMTFFERTKSVIGHSLMYIIWPRMVPNRETKVFREEFDPNFPDIMDLAKECPLVMVNSNELYELPRPTLAKVVNIGGLGVQSKDAKPLTGIFGEVAASGKKIILMSFGSVAPAHLMPESWKEGLLTAFARHSDKEFFFRYEKDDLNDRLSPNVHLSKWLPQNDLLQHKNTVAFISHGGYNSLQEVITAGKPLITIALFGDQPKNAKIAAKHGIAVNLGKHQVTEEDVYNAIKEVTENKKYSKNALRLHKMVEKQPISAEQLLVKWTEFTAEFKTLENLVPAGQHLNFIEYNSIDVYAFLFSFVFAVILVIFVILRCIYRKVKCCFCSSSSKKDKKE